MRSRPRMAGEINLARTHPKRQWFLDLRPPETYHREFRPEWRNWYTHQTQNLAGLTPMSVRVRPPAPPLHPNITGKQRRFYAIIESTGGDIMINDNTEVISH